MKRAASTFLWWALLLAGGAWAQEPPTQPSEQPLTNADVVALLSAGLPARVVAAKIASTPRTGFDTSVETLAALAKDGVDPTVLEAMVVSSSRQQAERTNFHGTPCRTPGVFAERGGKLLALHAEGPGQSETSGVASGLANVAITRATGGWFSPGFGPDTRVTVPGTRAELRMTQGRPTFLVCFGEFPLAAASAVGGGHVDPAGLRLVALRVRKGRDARIFDVGKRRFLRGVELGIPRKHQRAVVFDELNPGVYRVRPERALAPGEYAFYGDPNSMLSPLAQLGVAALHAKVFAFGVDGG